MYSQYALIATDEAIIDSGLNLDKVDKDRVGVIWASGIGGLETFFLAIKSYVLGDGTPRFSPFFIPKMIAISPQDQSRLNMVSEVQILRLCQHVLLPPMQ